MVSSNVVKKQSFHNALTKEERKEAFSYYKRAFKPAAKYFIWDLVVMFIDVLLELSVPFISQNIFSDIDNLEKLRNGYILNNTHTSLGILINGSEHNIMTDVYLNIGIMVAMCLVAVGCGIMYMRLSTLSATIFSVNLRNELFHKIQEYSFKNLDHFETASLVTRITSDCNNIRMCVFMAGRMGLKCPMMLVAGAIFMFIINWALTLIILSVALIIICILSFIIIKCIPLYTSTQKKVDDVNREVEEDCNGVKEIKAFVRENFIQNKFNSSNEELAGITTRVMSMVNMNLPTVLFGLNICTCLILLLGGMSMGNNQPLLGVGLPFTAGNISAFSSYAVTFLMAFNFFSILLIQIVKAGASKRRLDECFIEKIDISYEHKNKQGDFDPNKIETGEIEFIDCGLSYSNDKNKLAIGPINLKIKSGEILGIIGGTGSGKTSLISLVSRLYDATTGKIKISGHNVKDYSLDALRNEIGVVNQKNVLFSGTIKENLLWGKKDATEAEIEEALKLSCSYDFVNQFNDKEETIVSQGGKSVSGGQKQRLCIARALIKKPKILILDDATSAVDNITEKHIKKSFYNELKDTTVIIIAQRITSVMDADRILVLDNGLPIGLGIHDELIKTCDVYKDIYDLQMSGVGE